MSKNKNNLDSIIELSGSTSKDFIKEHYQELLSILNDEGEQALREHLKKYSE